MAVQKYCFYDGVCRCVDVGHMHTQKAPLTERRFYMGLGGIEENGEIVS